jgi:hypothetical protein
MGYALRQSTKQLSKRRLLELCRVLLAVFCVVTSGFTFSIGNCKCGTTCCQTEVQQSTTGKSCCNDTGEPNDSDACCDVSSSCCDTDGLDTGCCCHGDSGSCCDQSGPCTCEHCKCRFGVDLVSYDWDATGSFGYPEFSTAVSSAPDYDLETPRAIREPESPFNERPVSLHALCCRWQI